MSAKTPTQQAVRNELQENELDHLVKTTFGASKPTQGSIVDKIMNKDGSQTFDSAKHSLEQVGDKAKSGYDTIKLQIFKDDFPFATTSNTVSSLNETSLTAPSALTVTYPTGATKRKAFVIATIKANNQGANEHNIGVTLQRRFDGGTWTDVRDLTANMPLTLPAVDASADSLTITEDITAVITSSGKTITFLWQVDSDNAGEVHYTSSFILVVLYDFSAT